MLAEMRENGTKVKETLACFSYIFKNTNLISKFMWC